MGSDLSGDNDEGENKKETDCLCMILLPFMSIYSGLLFSIFDLSNC